MAVALTCPRRLYLFSVPWAILVVAVVLTARTQSPINLDNAQKIQHGMRISEVEAIFGGPARSEAKGPVMTTLLVERNIIGADGPGQVILDDFQIQVTNLSSRKVWVTDDLVVMVDFDSSWKVRVSRTASAYLVRRASLLEMLYDWIRP